MLNTYALIDGVMRQTAITELYTGQEPIQTIPLYINTPYKDNYELGPILVAALQGSNLMQQLESWHESASFIQSSQILSVVAEHLKQLITIKDTSGTDLLFRFADPLTTWYWLNSYDTNALVDIMGPIEQWQVAIPQHVWQQQETQWQTFTNPQTPPLGLAINAPKEPQEQAFQKAADFRFIDKIYQWLQTNNPKPIQNKTADQITHWLQKTFEQAKANDMYTERGIVKWIDLCADYGEDFASDPTLYFQKWLNNHPEQQKLPMEVKIENFYQYINS